jgi:hypothetical protein
LFVRALSLKILVLIAKELTTSNKIMFMLQRIEFTVDLKIAGEARKENSMLFGEV